MLCMHDPLARVLYQSASKTTLPVRHNRPGGIACCPAILVYYEAQVLQI